MMNSFKLLIVLAAIAILMLAGCERKVINEVVEDNSAGAVACFNCHGDDDFDLIAARMQYNMSVHGTGDKYNRNRNNSSRYSSCEPCHTNEGFVASVTGTAVSGDHFTRISCFTCHEPHSSGALAVRVTTAVILENNVTFDKNSANLCASCHHSRRDVRAYVTDSVTLSGHWGPHHSNQADMLIGTNAYEYAGYTYDNSAHTNTTVNGCLDCHMVPSLYATGGHTFMAYDAVEDYENTKGCNVATCHDGDVSNFNYLNKKAVVDSLLTYLEPLLVAANLYDDIEEEPVTREVATADSAGALYNFEFVSFDHSSGAHNSRYAIDLLTSSINFLETGDPNGSPNGPGTELLVVH